MNFVICLYRTSPSGTPFGLANSKISLIFLMNKDGLLRERKINHDRVEMTDQELPFRIVGYVERLGRLMEDI